jgi:hypothetical protein
MKRWLSLRPLFSPEALLVLLAVASRLLPHAPNFTAVGACAFFAGFFFTRRREALAVPLAAMLLSDLVLGFHPILLWVYTAFVLSALLGHALKDDDRFSWGRVLLGNVGAALVFFFITNFGVWLGGDLYALTWPGLNECFEAALPFFRATLASQLFFGAGLFATHRFLQARREGLHQLQRWSW